MTYLLESSICLSVLYLFYHILLRGLPSFQWNRIYLLSMYAISLIVPILNFNVYPIYVNYSNQTLTQNFGERSLVTIEHTSFSLVDIMYGIYIFILIVLLFRLILNLAKTTKDIMNSPKHKTANYVLVEGNNKSSVYSFFRYIIKPQAQEIPNEVIEHEMIHVKQYHSIDLIISELVKSILWFNPFSYLSQNAVKINHEYICDDIVSKKFGRYNYALLLNDMSYNNSKLKYVNNFSFKLKNRITMLQKIDQLNQNKSRYILLLPLVFGALHLFSFNTYIVGSPKVKWNALDSIPQIKSEYAIDTITIFDVETYEETMELKKRIVNDTVVIFDSNTYEETFSIVPRVDDCFILIFGNRAFSTSTSLNIDEAKALFNNTSINVASLDDKCDKVDDWTGKIIISSNKEDVKSQLISNEDNNVDKTLYKSISKDTKIYLDNITINGDVKLKSIVLSVE